MFVSLICKGCLGGASDRLFPDLIMFCLVPPLKESLNNPTSAWLWCSISSLILNFYLGAGAILMDMRCNLQVFSLRDCGR